MLVVPEGAQKLLPSGFGSLLYTAVVIVTFGFLGTQRVWFLRIFRGGPIIQLREAVSLSREFLGRFVVLSFVGGLFILPLILVVDALTNGFVRRAGTPATSQPGALSVSLLCSFAIADVLMTFVTPALALSYRSVRAALSTGIRMITQMWPQSAWYIVTPGIVATTFAALLPASAINRWLAIVIVGVGGSLALWFKGATIAFYARAIPIPSETGAAYL
ncbi:MAG: hypothetical protein ACYDD4_05300 [Acidimicrobiales bacterium]